MKISNTFIRRILDSCDLIGILGRILACVGEIGELTYPLPMGIESIFTFPRHICDR